MNAMDLLTALGGVKDAYVVEAMEFRKGKQKTKRLSLRKAWLIAAVILLALLLVGCTVAYVLSIKDMTFGERVQEYYDGSSQTRTLLSVQGVKGTPGYQASREWYEWRQAYDTDEAIYHSEEAFSEDFGDDYYAYNLYSREMKDKVDEICARYGLELLGKIYPDPDVEAACVALQIPGFFRSDAQVEADWSIRYYENGSFTLEGDVTLTGEAHPQTRLVRYDCSRKDAFSDLYETVGPVGSYQEWNYTTSQGVDVLMVMDQNPVRVNTFLMVDRGPYIFTFSYSGQEDEPPMEKEELEAYAEAFDFTIEPQRITEDDLEAAEERRVAADQEWAEEYEKKLRSYQEKGYGDRIKFQKEHCVNPDLLGFALMDIDGNGTDDLLVGKDGYLRAAYTTVDDGTMHMIMQRILYSGMTSYEEIIVGSYAGPTCMYLCQDGCLAFVYKTMDGLEAYHFAKPEGGKLVWAEMVYYDPANPDQPWGQWQSEGEFTSRSTPISQARFEEIIASHPRRPLTLLPISEFPLGDDSPSGIGMAKPVYRDYGELIRAEANWGNWSYCLMDLDGDGQKELSLRNGGWNGVFGVTEGQVRLLVCGDDLRICDGNIIASTRTYPDGNQTHLYFRLENGKAVLTDYLRYDKDLDSENPWFQSSDCSGQDISMKPVSQEMYEAVQAKYTPVEPDVKPVSQYPG